MFPEFARQQKAVFTTALLARSGKVAQLKEIRRVRKSAKTTRAAECTRYIFLIFFLRAHPQRTDGLMFALHGRADLARLPGAPLDGRVFSQLGSDGRTAATQSWDRKRLQLGQDKKA